MNIIDSELDNLQWDDANETLLVEIADKAVVLLEQEKLKNTFIADATHELRTPLAIIKGNVELALRDKDTKVFPIDTFRAINVEINHLAGLLSDLTILTRENQFLNPASWLRNR